MDAGAERAALRALLAALEARQDAAPLRGDEALLTAVARRHRLSALLSASSASALPPALAEAFRRDRMLTAARGLFLADAAGEAVKTLAAAGVETIVLKGLAYEPALYGGAGHRPTSDVDLLVPDAKRRDAFGALDRLGYAPRAAAPGFDDATYHEVAWSRGAVEIDLHLGLAPRARCAIDDAAVWAERLPFEVGGAPAARLAPAHAAVFHALHMAIDHFDVPALYLVDLSRLLPGPAEIDAAAAVARAWRCARPLETALALAASFLPAWAARAGASRTPAPARSVRVAAAFGGLAPLDRPTQLLRKLEHFDTPSDALRYVAVQARRNVREAWERRVRRRTPRERLNLG